MSATRRKSDRWLRFDGPAIDKIEVMSYPF